MNTPPDSAAGQTTKPTIIDANMHWLPETLFSDPRLLNKFLSTPPREHGIEAVLRPIPDSDLREIVIEQPRGYPVLDYAENNYDFEGQIADMEKAGVSKAILRLPCWQEWLDLEGCQMVNDGLAAHMARAPDRFAAMVAVPPWGSDEMIREAETRLAQPGFAGVQMAAHYGDLYLDDRAFRPFLKFLNDNRVPVVVHHTPLPVDFASLVPYTNVRRQMGRVFGQATAVSRELFSGLFDELPDLRLSHSMLGGGFFAFVNMLFPPQLDEFHDEVARFDDVTEHLHQQLRSNIFFDMSGAPQWGKAQLECAVAALGESNIFYGGSYPIRRDWFFKGPAAIAALDVPESTKTALLGGNAQRFFGLG